MKPGKVTTPVILGQPWQRTYNSVPNWRREGITYEKEGTRFFVPFIEEACYTSDDNSDAESQTSEPSPQEDKQEECELKPIQAPSLLNTTSQQAKEQPKPLLAVNTSRTPTNSNKIWVPRKLYQAQEGHDQIWIPKKSTPQLKAGTQSTSRYPRVLPAKLHNANKGKDNQKRTHAGANNKKFQNRRSSPHTKPQHRWVPKKALHAQGYYQGATQIWLPKPLHSKKTTTKTAPATQKQANYRWVPKQRTTDPPPSQQSKKQIHATKGAPKRATAQDKGKWIPKQQTSLQTNKPFSTAKVASRTYTAHEEGKWVPKIQKMQPKEQATAEKPTTSQETSTQLQEGQASRAKVTDKARQLAYLLMTLNQEKLVKLWLQQRAIKGKATNAASTTQATGPYMLQYPPLAQH